MHDVYQRLSKHLADLIMGYPFSDALTDLLKEMFTPVEAEVVLSLPNNLEPLEVVGPEKIVSRTTLPEATVVEALESLAERNMIFSALTKEGNKGYALLQVGFGIPQTFFWGASAMRQPNAWPN